MRPTGKKEEKTDSENWKAPLQERFERSIPGCRVFATGNDVYIAGTYGIFDIGRRYGGNFVTILLKQSPYDVSRVEGQIKKRLEYHGYQVMARRAVSV